MLDAATTLPSDTHNPDEPRCGSRWFCCQTHPQAERWARDNLSRQGYTPYLPLITINRTDRATPTIRHRVETPLFRSYLFIAAVDHWAPIRHTRGISRLLMSDGKPGILARGVVEAVQAAVAFSRCPAQNRQWAPGSPCSLATGAFYGLPAVVTAVHASTATIAIMMLGQLRTLSVSTDSLEPREDF